jgi:hypothetical protein
LARRGAGRIFNRYMGVDYSGALTKNATKRRTIAGQKGSGDPPPREPITAVRCLELVTERGSIRKVEAAPGGRWTGARCRRGPGRFRNGIRVFVRRLAAKIKFKLGGTFQIFNPAFGHVR